MVSVEKKKKKWELPLSVEECGRHDARVTRCFERHDVNKSGRLDRDQLSAALTQLLRKPVDEKQVDELVSHLGCQRGDNLSLREFHRLFDATTLRSTFDQVDKAKNGAISVDELAEALSAAGSRMSRRQAERMLRMIDKDQSGDISWDEFYRAFEFVPLATIERVAQRWSELAVSSDSDFFGPTLVPKHLTAWQTVVAGTASSIASRTTTAPLERLKVDAQAFGLATGNTRRNNNLWASAASILRNEGIAGFFRGNFLHCLRVFPAGIVSCWAYNALDGGENPSRRIWQACCVSLATGLASAVTYPLDSLRTRWIAQASFSSSEKKRFNRMATLLLHIVRTERVGALYRGLLPTLYAIVPFTLIQSATIDIIRDSNAEMAKQAPAALDVAVAGAFASLAAQTVVFPLETVHRRMQLGPSSSSSSTWRALRRIVRNEGVGALYRGLTATCLKSVPSATVGSYVAITIMDYFKTENETRNL